MHTLWESIQQTRGFLMYTILHILMRVDGLQSTTYILLVFTDSHVPVLQDRHEQVHIYLYGFRRYTCTTITPV